MKDEKLRAALRYWEDEFHEGHVDRVESGYAALRSRVDDLQGQVVALRRAFDELFDIAADELGFEAARAPNVLGEEAASSPRRLRYVQCPPTVARTIPRRARKAGGAK